ncbi:MAG: transglutaminase family protein [Cyanobacteria bacterium P01_E01_bin.6]
MKTMIVHPYLRATEVINWHEPHVKSRARVLAGDLESPLAIAKTCFEWVRDHIRHSVDYRMNPVTCSASDVLTYKTGYCFAKSHLLAALLRANGIPSGFCYQRLSIDDQGSPYCLHGLNSIYLEEFGWYRVDARGNREGIDTQFYPPAEHLAFSIHLAEERDFPAILPDPLPLVIDALHRDTTWDDLLLNLPDVSADHAHHYGLQKLGASCT